MTATDAPPSSTIRPSTIRAAAGRLRSRHLTRSPGRALRASRASSRPSCPPSSSPLFFFVVNIGTLAAPHREQHAGFDFKAFMMPRAILFAVTGVSRAAALVTDIQDGYFDRLLLTPVRRLALLLGLMVADVAVACGLTVPMLLLGFALGVRFETGLLGVLVFIAAGRAVGPRLHRLPLRHRPQDRATRRR